MIYYEDIWVVIRDFLELGGDVLLVIFMVTLVMWSLIIERYLYLIFSFPKEINRIKYAWNQRKDKGSWKALRVRETIICESFIKLNSSLPFIKALVRVCPLFGLLGTVTGMIEVFDIMAVTGTENARLMAAGISMATVSTLAGMLASLSGLFFIGRLEHKASLENRKLAESLSLSS